MNVIILRSEKEEMREVEEENNVGKEVSVGPPSEKLENEKPKEVQVETNAPSVKPYLTHILKG